MEKVKAFLRIKGEKKDEVFSFTDKSVLDGSTLYEFDSIFSGRDQVTVYNEISTLLKEVKKGCNLTLFAYGQTGSGKTYTMEGTKEERGIIPRVIEDIYKENITATFSVLEIYNEKIVDMINQDIQVTIREDKSGIVAEGLTNVFCQSKEEALDLFQTSALKRRVESNGVNTHSSRSHLIFIIKIKSQQTESKITLVDLAGSERLEVEEDSVKRPKLEERYRETGNINKSLLYLSRIISTLSLGKQKHINYRDSKLTFLLRESLIGPSKLVIIGAVNIENVSETRNTLKFLSTAKKIKLLPSDLEKTTEKLIDQIRYLNMENTQLHEKIRRLEEDPLKKEYHKEIDCLIEETDSFLQKINTLTIQVDQITKNFFLIQNNSNALQESLFHALCQERKEQIENLDQPQNKK